MPVELMRLSYEISRNIACVVQELTDADRALKRGR